MARYIKIENVEYVLRELMYDITKQKGGYKYLNEDCKAEYDRLENILNIIQDIKPASVKEVVYGEWLPIINTGTHDYNEHGNTLCKCSLCGRREANKEPHCHCGADMRGKYK